MPLSENTDAVITCHDLTKIYDTGVTALNELTLTVERGSSLGLLGENGAGKSTLVRLIMGFIAPTRGELRVLGERKVSLAHPRIGYLHERTYVELRFTARRYLSYMAGLSGLWGKHAQVRIDNVLAQVDLSSVDNQRLSTYSKGMLQRLCIAQSLLTDPELLILDEPTSGLDPYSQWKVRQIISDLCKQGKTLLICSHYLAEVEQFCNRVGILQHGRLIESSAVKDLIHTQEAVEIILQEDLIASEIVTRLGLNTHILATADCILKIPSSSQALVLESLVNARIPIHSLNPVSRTLEEAYISSTRPEVNGRVP